MPFKVTKIKHDSIQYSHSYRRFSLLISSAQFHRLSSSVFFSFIIDGFVLCCLSTFILELFNFFSFAIYTHIEYNQWTANWMKEYIFFYFSHVHATNNASFVFSHSSELIVWFMSFYYYFSSYFSRLFKWTRSWLQQMTFAKWKNRCKYSRFVACFSLESIEPIDSLGFDSLWKRRRNEKKNTIFFWFYWRVPVSLLAWIEIP